MPVPPFYLHDGGSWGYPRGTILVCFHWLREFKRHKQCLLHLLRRIMVVLSLLQLIVISR
uniref:Uncharacterized protein n=1 Tax=Oryza brachyantha TaxID=4533 RepID=J3MK85_ORYBR